jgi:hypothetical protein
MDNVATNVGLLKNLRNSVLAVANPKIGKQADIGIHRYFIDHQGNFVSLFPE